MTRRADREFYRWRNIAWGAWAKDGWQKRARHLAYAGGWKKCEPLWDLVIRARRVTRMLPLLEATLSAFGRHTTGAHPAAGSHALDRGESVEPASPPA
jgi:hypothetical protein